MLRKCINILLLYIKVLLYINNNLHFDWGWKLENNSLDPIKMDQAAAPSKLLKVIFCSCKKPCGKACSCRKAGLYCTSVCGSCSENNCRNSPPVDTEENPVEEYPTEEVPQMEDYSDNT